jgi:hypothetical protein
MTKQFSKIVAIISALTIVACNKEQNEIAPNANQTEKATVSTVETLPIETTFSMQDSSQSAQLPESLRNLKHEPSQDEKELVSKISQRKTLSPTKNVQVYAYLYCESKGGDDGHGLEIYGNTTANIVNINGVVTTPPNFGSTVLMNRASNVPIFIRPGFANVKYLSTVRFSVANAASQYLRFQGALADQDMNDDDGYFPNQADQMGSKLNYLSINTAMTAYPYVYWQRYFNGNQIVWIKNVVYVW